MEEEREIELPATTMVFRHGKKIIKIGCLEIMYILIYITSFYEGLFVKVYM